MSISRQRDRERRKRLRAEVSATIHYDPVEFVADHLLKEILDARWEFFTTAHGNQTAEEFLAEREARHG